jgi:uncharacterized protein with gpF-like domain
VAAAAAAYLDGGRVSIDLALRPHEARLAAILGPHWRRTFAVFGERTFDAAKGVGVLDTKDAQSDFAQRTRRWIELFGADKVKAISETTKQRIIQALDDGLAEGESITRIAKRIRETGRGVIGAARSLVIARTETHSASQAAATESLDVLGLPEVRREWVSSNDARTRETHRSADGQIRGQNEPFDVGDAKLMYPGDPAGPPEETVACRCIAAAVISD